MTYNILLNKKTFHFNESSLPCLIHYKEKTGGSQFTITLVADLFLQGSKILFLTAYPMAKDNFFEQTKGSESKILFIENKKDLLKADKYQAIIINSGDGDLYSKAIEALSDINERVVLIKNFELFDKSILEESLKLKKIIFSGDIDKCLIRKQIGDKFYETIIAFSESEIKLPINLPALEKYVGYMKNTDKEGLINIEM